MTSFETQYHAADAEEYHDFEQCPRGRQIPEGERISGTGGKRLCAECERRHRPTPPSHES